MFVAIKKFKEKDDNEYVSNLKNKILQKNSSQKLIFKRYIQVRKTALREIRILKQLKHDHIVNLIEVFRENGRIFLVFEQLSRTILEEIEGQNDSAGLEPLEVRFNLL